VARFAQLVRVATTIADKSTPPDASLAMAISKDNDAAESEEL
jgi:hypothetical protein